MLAPLLRVTGLVEDDPEPLKAPRTRTTVAPVNIDDDFVAQVVVVDEDENQTLQISAARGVALPVFDEEFVVVVEEDEDQRQAPQLRLVPLPPQNADTDHETVPILEEDNPTALLAPRALTVAPHVIDPEEATVVVLEEDNTAGLAAPHALTAVPASHTGDEEVTPQVLEDDNSNAIVAPRLLRTGALPDNDVDFPRRPPPPPPAEEGQKKKKRTGQLEWPNDEYFDDSIAADNERLASELEEDNLVAAATIAMEILADAVTVEVNDLLTQTVVKSLKTEATQARANTGVTVGKLDTTSTTSSAGVTVDADGLDTDVTIIGDDEDT